MNFFVFNSIVGANFDSVASLTDKNETTPKILETFNFTVHDMWLYLVSLLGIAVLAVVIVFVMYRKKGEVK